MCGKVKLVVLTTSDKSLDMLSVPVTHMAKKQLATVANLQGYNSIEHDN